MSRTTRKSSDNHDHSCNSEVGDCDYLRDNSGRDGKEEHAPSWWKRLRRRSEKEKTKAAFRNGRQIPVIKKNDDWEWF